MRVRPPRLYPVVRVTWVYALVIIKKEDQRNCGGRSQNKDVRIIKGIIVISQNSALDRWKVSEFEGSKDEKMSTIIQDLKGVIPFVTLKVISLFNLRSW